MKLSARNQLKGRIVQIDEGVTTTIVRIDIGGKTITASITNAAAVDLALAVGLEVTAIVKASDVMIGIE